MKVEMTFSIEKIKQALDTVSEELPTEIRERMVVLTIDVSKSSNKYKDIQVFFLRNKVKAAYEAAVSHGSDEVTLVYEFPSDEDWAAHGFVRQGDLMVRKED